MNSLFWCIFSTDLDSKSPSSAEIAELFKQEKEESPAKHRAGGFFSGSSVSIQTVVGADGVSASKCQLILE